MDEMAGFLCGAFIVLAVIMVLGHCIWAVLAAIIRWLSGAGSEPSKPSRRCPACHLRLPAEAIRCKHCGRELTPQPVPQAAGDLPATLRQLARLHGRGWIETPEYERLIRLLRQAEAEAKQTLVAKPAAPAAAERRQPPVSAAGEEIVDAVVLAEPATPPDRRMPLPSRAERAGVKPVAGTAPQSPATRKATHALDRDYAEQLAAVSPARRQFAEVLQAFMAEKNIRWGELVAGLLIVGSAVGLVISLREKLEHAIPYFPALIFMLITMGIYGAGIYTLRRWSLRATSRGVLTIALLLMPLNFLAAIIMPAPDDPLVYALAVAVGLLAGGWVTYSAGRALLPHGWWRLTSVILATSAGQLFIDRLAGPGLNLAQTSLLAALPLGGFLVATVTQIQRAMPWWHLSGRRARQLLLVLGISAFALAAPLGLLISESGPLRGAIAQLGPTFSLVAAVVLATGLLIHRRITAPRLAAMRTTGTTLAVAGAMLMGGAVVVAWPRPDLLIAVGLTNAAILILLALRGGLPILHTAAVGCLALALLVGFHAVQGKLPGESDAVGRQLFETLLLGRSSLVLTVLALASCGAALAWIRWKRQQDGIAYLMGAAGLAAAGLAVAFYAGFGSGGDRNLTTPVFAFYAIATMLAAALLPLPIGRNELPTRQALAWSGSGLLLVTLIHGLWANATVTWWLSKLLWQPQRPLLAALVSHADLCAVLALLLAGRQIALPSDQRRTGWWQSIVNPLAWSALATGTLAVPAALWVRDQAFALHAGYVFAAAVAWLAAAVLYRRDDAAATFHALATVGIGFLVAAYCRSQSWCEDWRSDPRHVQIQVMAVAAWCAAWSVVRMLTAGRAWAQNQEPGCSENAGLLSRRQQGIAGVLGPQWLTINEALVAFALLTTLVLGFVACQPGLAVELGFDSALSADAWHTFTYDAGAWLCLAMLLAALPAQLWNRLSSEGVVELLVGLAVVPLLIAPHWEAGSATGSALRWSLAAYVLVTGIWVWMRASVASGVRSLRRLGWQRIPDHLGSIARESALLIGGVPIVLVTTIVASRRMSGSPVGFPDAQTIFGQMGTTLSYAVPLLVLVAVLVGHAIREKRAAYMLAGSVLLQFVTCLAFALKTSAQSPSFWAELLQWNAVALGGYTVVWMGLQRWLQAAPLHAAGAGDGPAGTGQLARLPLRPPLADLPLTVQMGATISALTVMAVWAAVNVFLTPRQLPAHCTPLGDGLSYVAWLFALGACLGYAYRQAAEQWARWAGYCALMLVAFLAVTVDRQDTTRIWYGYHLLTYGWVAVAAGWTAASFRWPKLGSEVVPVCVLIAFLALRGTTADPDPLAPWWSVCAAAGGAALIAILALARRSQDLAYPAVLFVLLATSIGVVCVYDRIPLRETHHAVVDFVQANLLALSAAGVFWLLVDLWHQRRGQAAGFDPKFRLPATHVVACLVSVAISALFFTGSLLINSVARSASARFALEATDLGGVLAICTLGTLLIGSLWEARRGYGIPCLYVWGALVVAVVLDRLAIQDHLAFWAIGMAAGGYATLTSLIWRQGALLASIGGRWGIRDPVAGLKRTAAWLPVVNLLVAAFSALATLIVVLVFPERWMRISSGMMPAVLAIGLAALAQKERRTLLEFVSLLMTGVAAVCLSWADLQPEWNEQMVLERLVRMLIALAGLAFIYGTIVVRRVPETSPWRLPVQRIAITFGGGAMAALLGVLLLERIYYEPGIGAPIGTPAMLAVVVVLVAMTVGFISLALLPKRAWRELTEHQRRMCVYAAEVVATLIFAHVYMCKPMLFAGFFRPYWPYIVMAIAFAGVGVGELFERSGIRVLSDPLQRTSAFLPLIPALGFWIVAAEKSNYSVVLFTAGVVYLVLSMLRRSAPSLVAAVVAGNAALWSLLADSDMPFWQNPQFWLIPPAASALIAGQINRRHLKPAQLAALRYACVLVIYLSSTSEIFLRGIDESLWPPMVLAALSVAGVFVGIMLQVRAFLYLGTTFVLLSVISMVWHAQRAQGVWVWWAFGICLGICILVIFGLFEKKRPEITAWVRQLQQWEQ